MITFLNPSFQWRKWRLSKYLLFESAAIALAMPIQRYERFQRTAFIIETCQVKSAKNAHSVDFAWVQIWRYGIFNLWNIRSDPEAEMPSHLLNRFVKLDDWGRKGNNKPYMLLLFEIENKGIKGKASACIFPIIYLPLLHLFCHKKNEVFCCHCVPFLLDCFGVWPNHHYSCTP